MIKPTCKNSSDHNVKLRKTVSAGHVNWFCLDCNDWAEKPVKWIPHRIIEDYLKRWDKTISDIPVIER